MTSKQEDMKEEYKPNYCIRCGCFIEQGKTKCNKCFFIFDEPEFDIPSAVINADHTILGMEGV